MYILDHPTASFFLLAGRRGGCGVGGGGGGQHRQGDDSFLQTVHNYLNIWDCSHTFLFKKSCIRETPTLSTDANSRTDTILKRLHDLPIRTEKRTWSTQKCGWWKYLVKLFESPWTVLRIFLMHCKSFRRNFLKSIQYFYPIFLYPIPHLQFNIPRHFMPNRTLCLLVL